MQKEESLLELQAEVLALKNALQKIHTRRRIWCRSVLGIFALCVSLSLYAQTPAGQAQLGSLGNRVGNLEQRIDKLEKRLTNDEIGNTNFPNAPDDNSVGDRLSALEKAFKTLQDENGNGRGRIGASVMAPFHVVDESGQLIFSVDGLSQGAVVYGKDNSSAKIGPNLRGAMGVRLYAAGAKLASGGMDLLTNGNGDLFVGTPGKALAVMTVSGGVGDIAVVGESGKNLSDLTVHPGGGGVLNLANPSAQIVSVIDVDPQTNEGRAIFTDAGGQPLAKIGAAGSHGDVLIGGNGKGFQLWAHMLTGLP